MTTQNTHTPGPWTVEHCRNEDGSPFLSISGQGPLGAWLADIQPGSINGKPLDVTQMHEANARLIAAAPDLLAALKEMTELKHFTATRSEKESADAKARAAIAKAKGAT